MKVEELSENIETKKDFEVFLENLRADFDTNKDEWENRNLKDFLEALHAYTSSIEGYYKNMDIPFDENRPTWLNFADVLLGATVYE